MFGKGLLQCLDALESDENRRTSAVEAEASGTYMAKAAQSTIFTQTLQMKSVSVRTWHAQVARKG